jgi:thiol-disulfide isomerase/thioredoxin
MRYILAGAIGLLLLAPAWADDKKTDKPAEAPKTLAEQLTLLTQAYEREMNELGERFEKAKAVGSEAEMTRIGDKAMKQVSPECLKKLMSLAADHPHDLAAVDALIYVCTNPYLVQFPQSMDAFKTLLKDYAGSEKLGFICEPLVRREDGIRLIRQVFGAASNPTAKLESSFYLALALQEGDPTPAQLKEAEKLLADLMAKAKTINGLPAEMVKDAEVMTALFPGKAAPPAESRDLADNAASLATHRGKVVVLDFWATWCGPCRKMIPHERQMVKKYAGRPFQWVSISVDEKKDELTSFLKEEPMPWVHWLAGPTGPILKTWYVHGFPTLYVIDAKGVIRAKFANGGPETEKKLDDLVEELVKEAGGKNTN